jgi:ATP-dependent helicase/nuclease subunit A
MATSLIEQDINARKQALDISKSYIVQAPAGSGKTELLTQRYLALLAHVATPEQIIAITFTKKAAAEMRERIIKALQAAAADIAIQHAHEQTTRQLANAALKQNNSMGWNLLEEEQRMRLITIDSLSGMLTKAMPVKVAGCGLSDIATQPEYFYQLAIDKLFNELNKDNALSNSIANLLNHCDNQWHTLANLLLQLLQQREQWLQYIVIDAATNVSFKQYLQQSLDKIISSNQQQLLQIMGHDICANLWEIIKLVAPNISDMQPEHPWYNLDKVAVTLGIASQKNWLALYYLLFTQTGSWRKTFNKTMGFTARDKQIIAAKAYLQEVINAFATNNKLTSYWQIIGNSPCENYANEQWDIIADLITVLPILTAQLQLIFKEHQVVDFAQINLAADFALGDQNNPTELAFYLEHKIQHLLIDEFQDTSRLHFNILEKIIAHWSAGDGHSLFIVGDPQQSIYRFRQADVGLFLQVKKNGIADIKLEFLQLCQNFRSNKTLVEWFNACFSSIFGNDEDQNQSAIANQLAAATKEASTENSIFYYPITAEDLSYAQALPAIINNIKKQNALATIAILVRSRSHLYPTLDILRQEKITYNTVEIERLDECVEVLDLITLTLALHKPGDRQLWLALLRAPWCGLSLNGLEQIANYARDKTIIAALLNADAINLSPDDQSRLQHSAKILLFALTNKGRQSTSDWIKGTYIALDGHSCLQTDFAKENVELFFAALHKLTMMQLPINAENLGRQLHQIYASTASNQESMVSIMTIHKSKGLQFDHVLLTHLDKSSPSENTKLLRWIELKINLQQLLLLAPMHAKYRDTDKIYSFIKMYEQLQLDNEMKRLFYVACTRAKTGLHFLYKLKTDKKQNSFLSPASHSMLNFLWQFDKDILLQCNTTLDIVQQPEIITAEDFSIMRLKHMNTNNELLKNITKINYSGNKFPLDLQNNDNAVFGNLLHLVLQQIADIGIENYSSKLLINNSQQWQQYLTQYINNKAIVNKYVTTLLTSAHNWLLNPRAKWILSNAHQAAHTEYSLQYMQNGKIKTAIIDRVFVANDVCWIIDYKSTQPEPTQSIADFFAVQASLHRAQLAKYAELYRQITHYPIRTAIFFPIINQWLDLADCVTDTQRFDNTEQKL